jgi:hypothetical protein
MKEAIIRMSMLDCGVVYCDILYVPIIILVISSCSVLCTLGFA